MQRLTQRGTPETPAVDLDPASGVLRITGRSIPENAHELYGPILA